MNFKSMYEPWKTECIAYSDIIKDAKNRQRHHKWNQDDEKDFQAVIHSEADRVEAFISRKEREIESRIAYCERILNQKKTSEPNSNKAIHTDLTDIIMDLTDLSKYARYNFLVLQKLIRAHKDFAPSYSTFSLHNITQVASLDVQRFDHAIVRAASLRELCNVNSDRPTSKKITANYWIHPDNLNEVKATLLFHLPESDKIETTTTYLDNSEFTVFEQWLERDTGAESIQFRYLGSDNNDVRIVEQLIRHAAGSYSIKSLSLPTHKLNDFVDGAYTPSHYAAEQGKEGVSKDTVDTQKNLASDLQNSIINNQLMPVFCTRSQRTTFKLPGTSTISFTLEEDLMFERKADHGPKENNTIIGFNEAEVHTFPYALFRVQFEEVLPSWLSEILKSSLVYEVPYFSSHLHGISLFYKSSLSLLPWWLSQSELDIRNGSQPKGNPTVYLQCKSRKSSTDGQYQIGYLESQLSNITNLKRSQSNVKKTSIVRSGSTRSTRMPNSKGASTKSNLSFSAAQNGNPFDDPIWSQKNEAYEIPMFKLYDRPASNADTFDSIKHSGTHHENSSTQRLMDDKNSSANPSRSNSKTKDEKYLDKHFGEDVDLEEGRQEGDGEKKKKKKKDKEGGATVEPKTLFANERTFIHWLNFAATLLTTALTLMNFGDRINNIVGAIFFGIAFLFVFYSFGFNRWRAYRILYKPHLRFDDVYGPVFLCILLVGALVLNFALRWNAPLSTTTYLGTNSTSPSDM
ncbi:Vacuolar transporter chaperone 4 [Choanephora cucurbitarum]|uniref:Vacuolar transporter chaperone 4 n=1 Tax=Choanephora cucurbitarum TaxID=101091 RepID=A0A1C7NQQ2_9FUNG|nr:Vacuolar transporter chaperone 4 [Choanephora cucurbitarum]